jgi:hypothetical protein
MPLTGAMANADRHLPVPGHQGVRVQAAAGAQLDTGLIAAALDDPGPAAAIGVTASSREALGGLWRWLAFTEPDTALLSYAGSGPGADASGVPAVFEFTRRGLPGRASPCMLGPAGFAALDLAGPAVAAEDPIRHRTLELAVRGYGEAGQQAARLAGLVTAWDAAGRPGIDRLHIDAYPSGSSPSADTELPADTGLKPATPAMHTTLHRATHTTFAVRFRPAPPVQSQAAS